MLRQSMELFLDYNRSVAFSVLKSNNCWSLRVKELYESKDLLDNYYTDTDLQKPEREVLERLKRDLPNMRMLDIGIGPGRTTPHFAPLVKEYVGVDYSKTMIEACRFKFPLYRLEVADARNLSNFDDGYFDFVLFSLNGIDSVEHKDRMLILKEVRRIIKNGGNFCFSSLNLNSWRLKRPFAISKNPVFLYRNFYNFLLNHEVWRILKKTDPEQSIMAYYRFKDFLFRNYFITPKGQIKQLKNAGFKNVEAFELATGKSVKDPENMLDYWVYYLAKV